MPKHSSQILEYAKRGAEARFRELVDELKHLTMSFPHLRDAVSKDDLPVSFIIKRDAGKAKALTARRRKPMSAAAKKAVSARMKRYWAARRKEKQG